MSSYFGNLCIECWEDTSFGSGRFVNRIPADNGVRDGYMCAECQSIKCDRCGEDTLEYTTEYNGDWLCPDCSEDHTACDYTCTSPEHY